MFSILFIVIIIIALIIMWLMKKPIDIISLVAEYKDKTGHLSAIGGIRRVPEFKQIVELGEKAIPVIINDIRCHGGRMAMYVLLWDITGQHPYHPLREDGFLKFDIQTEERAWLEWAKDRGI